MKKIEYKKDYKEIYKASTKKISYVSIPELKYLAIDGKGYPEKSKDFQPSIEALFNIVYTLKYALKFDKIKTPKNYCDYSISPLDSLWWSTLKCFDVKKPDNWRWTLMIIQPNFVNEKLIDDAKKLVLAKKNIPVLNKLRLEKIKEGKCAQMLHLGPYNSVGSTTDIIHNDFKVKSLTPNGKHHEIYLNDPRRVAPEKIKTIIRIPYK